MEKILTVTFNPTIDKSTVVGALVPEKSCAVLHPFSSRVAAASM